MDRRRREIKRRIANRKRKNQLPIRKEYNAKPDRKPLFLPDYQEQHDFEWFSSYDGKNENKHPLFNKDVFLMKLLIAACLVLVVAILFKNASSNLQPARNAVTQIMNKDFQFASVKVWYEETFGKPLALFPENVEPNNTKDVQPFAMPATAKILEEFDSDSKGVIIQTIKDTYVEAVQDGVVTFAGVNENLGKMVIVQHPDNSETWYGNLSEINVHYTDSVQAGDKLGVVSNSETGETGEFYFAVRKDEKFIDPVQVIRFE